MNGPADVDDLGEDQSIDESDRIRLTQLLAQVRSAPTAEELSCERSLVAAMVSVVASQSQAPLDLDAHRARSGSRRAMSKVATRVGIGAVVILVGASTAAATGTLPDAAQSALARATSHVGIDLHDPRAHLEDSSPSTTSPTTAPDPQVTASGGVQSADTSVVVGSSAGDGAPGAPASSAHTSTPTPTSIAAGATADTSTSGPVPVGPSLDGQALHGLCQAWRSHGDGSRAEQGSVAIDQLQQAATDAAQTVDEFCDERAPAPPPPTHPDSGKKRPTKDKGTGKGHAVSGKDDASDLTRRPPKAEP